MLKILLHFQGQHDTTNNELFIYLHMIHSKTLLHARYTWNYFHHTCIRSIWNTKEFLVLSLSPIPKQFIMYSSKIWYLENEYQVFQMANICHVPPSDNEEADSCYQEFALTCLLNHRIWITWCRMSILGEMSYHCRFVYSSCSALSNKTKTLYLVD